MSLHHSIAITVCTLLEKAPTEKRTEVADCIVKSFLDRKKGTDIIDDKGNNLLHYAADGCSEEVILTLIGKNVDPWLKNRNGETPVEIYTSKYPHGSGYLKKLKKATSRSNIAFYLMVTLGATVVISTFVTEMKVPGIIAATIVAPEVLYVIGAAVLVFAFIVRYITYKVCEPSTKIDDIKEVQGLSITNIEEEHKEKLANPVKLTHENRFFIMEKMEKKDLSNDRYEQEVKDLIKLVDQDEKITFSDVIVKDELKKELKVVCNNVSEKMQEKMKKLRYKPPAGYIFYGPPGTGKTLLARAIAGETDRSFISISGSKLVGKYAGHGVSHVRDLFKKAKQNAPCVIFIDEIDAIGRERSSDNNSASRDQNQTLNQLLTEMDGFKNNKDTVVIAATNRIETLDSALLRAGRFSKKIHIPLPDEGLRKEILKFYIKDLPTEELNLKDLAGKTKGFSGADISHLVNEVKLHVIYRTEEANEDDIKLTMSDFTTVLKRLRSATYVAYIAAITCARYAKDDEHNEAWYKLVALPSTILAMLQIVVSCPQIIFSAKKARDIRNYVFEGKKANDAYNITTSRVADVQLLDKNIPTFSNGMVYVCVGMFRWIGNLLLQPIDLVQDDTKDLILRWSAMRWFIPTGIVEEQSKVASFVNCELRNFVYDRILTGDSAINNQHVNRIFYLLYKRIEENKKCDLKRIYETLTGTEIANFESIVSNKEKRQISKLQIWERATYFFASSALIAEYMCFNYRKQDIGWYEDPVFYFATIVKFMRLGSLLASKYFGNKITEYLIGNKLDNNKYFQDFFYNDTARMAAAVIPLIMFESTGDVKILSIATAIDVLTTVRSDISSGKALSKLNQVSIEKLTAELNEVSNCVRL